MHALEIAAEDSNSKSTKSADLSAYLALVGTTVGSYQVVELIGKGGMAAVYMARHRTLGHEIAIKILHARHLTHPIMVRRFANEARAMAAIRHPGVVKVHDIRRHTDGRPYIVMELLEGESLRMRLKDGPLPEDEVITFSRQIALALAAAHARGMVHRDIKPDNIFLASDPELPLGERAKVLDFGIAKVSQPYGANLTRAGMLIGTPEYMSPEQCQGSQAVDARADIYGLGMLMYRMVAGQLPFRSGDDGEIIDRQIHEPFPPPRSVGAEISVDLERVLMTCLAKNPAHRFDSMAALAARLAQLEEQLEKTGVDTEAVTRVGAEEIEGASAAPLLLFAPAQEPIPALPPDKVPNHSEPDLPTRPPLPASARAVTLATRELPRPSKMELIASRDLAPPEMTTDHGPTDGELTVPDPPSLVQQHRTGALRSFATPAPVPRVVRASAARMPTPTPTRGTSTGIPLPLPAEPSEPEHLLVSRPVLGEHTSRARPHELLADLPDEAFDDGPRGTPVPASRHAATGVGARDVTPLPDRRVFALGNPDALLSPDSDSQIVFALGSGGHGAPRPMAGEHPSIVMVETCRVSIGPVPSRVRRMTVAAVLGLVLGSGAFWITSALGWL